MVVSPDNRCHVEINLAIHAEMQERCLVSKNEYRIEALVPRQDLTGPERIWAARYEFNDVVRYARASKEAAWNAKNTRESKLLMLTRIC